MKNISVTKILSVIIVILSVTGVETKSIYDDTDLGITAEEQIALQELKAQIPLQFSNNSRQSDFFLIRWLRRFALNVTQVKDLLFEIFGIWHIMHICHSLAISRGQCRTYIQGNGTSMQQ